jgi:hypothetical protein
MVKHCPGSIFRERYQVPAKVGHFLDAPFYFSIENSNKIDSRLRLYLFSTALRPFVVVLYSVQQTRPSISQIVTHSVPWPCILPRSCLFGQEMATSRRFAPCCQIWASCVSSIWEIHREFYTPLEGSQIASNQQSITPETEKNLHPQCSTPSSCQIPLLQVLKDLLDQSCGDKLHYSASRWYSWLGR